VEDRQVPLDLFVGRTGELARVTEVVTRAAAGQPWLIAIEGDPGVGKTSLARRCLTQAPGLKVLSARGDQAETDLDFGLVDQLLRAAGGVSHPVLPAGGADSAASFMAGARLLEVVGEQQAAGPLAIVLDDLQWADRRSVEALTFMLRRLSVDPVVAVVIYRGPSGQLDEAAQRMLVSVENRLRIPLGGLDLDEVTALAAALTPEPLDDEAVRWLLRRTGGHPLYLRTVLSERFDFDPRAPGRLTLPRSLAAAVSDHLRVLPPETRGIVQMLAVLNLRMPLAQLGQVAEVDSPSGAIEPAVASGLVDWWPEEPSCPVAIRHPLVRDAIYAGIAATRRRMLHARAAAMVSESASWEHRVAALDHPDEALAAELEHLAVGEAAQGRTALAATHLQWASDISPARADRERRLVTAALHLTVGEESRALALRPAVEEAAPSPLRGCVLGAMAFSAGQLGESEQQFTEALAQARDNPDSQPLAATIAGRLAGTYALLGDGEKVMTLGRWALGTGHVSADAAVSRLRTLIAVGASQTAGPHAGLAELGHLDADPARVGLADVDGLSFRGALRLQIGDLDQAVSDLAASLKLSRRGATLILGLRGCCYLALAQYLAGEWDDVLLTSEQGFSAAVVHSRRYELPMLHLAAGCVPAGRGMAEEAEQHARLAEEAAASLDYGQERVYSAMARALVCQASGDYLGMADALAPLRDEAPLASRSRVYAMLWRPLLAEGLIGSGQAEPAAALVAQMRAENGQVSYLEPALAWLEGWLAELVGAPEDALRIYQRGEDTASTQSPVHTARLLLAHGRLLRRTGHRKDAVDRLRRASGLYLGLRAAPFITQTEAELAACDLPSDRASKQPVLALTSRETEVAHLVGKGLSNPEIAAELFISRKAVEYHLGNIYAKCGLQGRQQLRRYVGQWRQPAAV
jgi:DNA-binding CsgD family transcriptional regulator